MSSEKQISLHSWRKLNMLKAKHAMIEHFCGRV